jgi:hypothetical protein
VKNQSDLKCTFVHPVYHADTYRQWKARQDKQVETDTGETVKPISGKQWTFGAAARCITTRGAIEASYLTAMAMTIMSTIEGDGPSYAAMNLVDLSGDQRDLIGYGARFEACLKTAPMKHIQLTTRKHWSGEERIVPACDDRAAALAELLTRSDLAALFSARIADICINQTLLSQPGAHPAELALRDKARAPDAGATIARSAEWMKRYTRSQQDALIDAYDIPLDNVIISNLKKAEADQELAQAFPAMITPIEARYYTKDQAKAAEAKLLKGEKV